MKTNAVKVNLFLFIVLLVGGMFLMNYLQESLRGTTMTLGVDLYPRWVGAQAILEGKSPYSFEARQMIWQEVYGSPDIPTGNPFGFYYPPAITTLFFPFILAGMSLETAAVAWCALSWALWSMAFLLWTTSIELPRRTRLIVLPLLLISGMVFRPAYSNYLLGQYSLFSVIMLALAWLSLKNNKPILAGIFSALCLIKFSLTIFPVMLLFFIHWRDWKAWLSFGVTSLILYLPPTLLLGWWVPDFIRDIAGYASENAVAWYWADVKTPAGIAWLLVSLTLLIRSLKLKDFDLAVFTALAINSIFVPHTADYDLVVFIPIILLLGYRALRSKRFKSWLSISSLGLIIWFPWISLVYLINQSTQTPQTAVESWYRFIWLSYPLIALFPVLLSELLSIHQKPPQVEMNKV